MRFPLIWRKTAEADIDAWKAEASRQRERAERALSDQATAEFNRQQVLVQNDSLDAACRRAKTAGEFDKAKAKRSADRIVRLQKAVARARAERAAEGRRARALQVQLDDALGLNEAAVAAGSAWQSRREQRMRLDQPTAEGAST